MRIDKFLWCVRLSKTRSIATKLVKDKKVLHKNTIVKPSKEVEIHDILSIKFPPTERLYKVLDFPKSRVGAKLVPLYLEEVTPQENIDILLEMQNQKKFNAYHGLKGRPTKRDRREMLKILSQRNSNPED